MDVPAVLEREDMLSMVEGYMLERFDRVALGSCPGKLALRLFIEWLGERGIDGSSLSSAYAPFYNELRRLEYKVPPSAGGFGYNVQIRGVKRKKG